MKSVLSYIFIVFGLVVLYASTSRDAMRYLSENRDGTKWWHTYPCLNGDLVSLSYLDFVPAFRSPHVIPHLDRAADNGKKNTVLVLDGDSFTWHLADSNFADLAVFNYINRSAGGTYQLDPAKRNILIIEVSERYLRASFESTDLFNGLRKSDNAKSTSLSIPGHTNEASMLPSGIGGLFNKNINQNLQFNLFNYNFIMPMFESKAALNYFLFNRASGDVVISDNRNCLFLKETVTRTDAGSSYAPVAADEVSRIVDVLNTIYDHYKQEGFSEVYFSMIPNSATIMQPAGYNGLIPAIQGHPALRMRIIDIYTVFKNSPEVYYLPGDTHWNQAGKQLWVNLVNNILQQDSRTL